MKKGQTESYSFLIGIIITVLILTGVGCAVYQIYKPKGLDSFNQLTKLLKDLEKKSIDAEGEIPFYVEENQVLLGFGKEQEYIGREGWKSIFNWKCYGIKFASGIYTPFGVTGKIERPRKNCPLGKSCLCLCKIKSTPYRITEDACQGNVKCETFDNLELVGGKGCPQGVFVPGRKASEGDKERGLASLYYSKQSSIVSIDDKKALTIEKLKEEIEKCKQESEENMSLNYFEEFISEFKKCIKAGNIPCQCSTIDLEKLPDDYKIKIEKKSDGIILCLTYSGKELKKSDKIKTKSGLICYKRETSVRKEFNGCSAIQLASKKIEFTGDCCDQISLKEWQGKTKIYLIKETDSGVYLTTKEEYSAC